MMSRKVVTYLTVSVKILVQDTKEAVIISLHSLYQLKADSFLQFSGFLFEENVFPRISQNSGMLTIEPHYFEQCYRKKAHVSNICWF